MFILVFVFAQIWWFPLKKKKIQICNSNLIIRQILLVFDILTVFDETEIISEFIMAALRNV